MARRTRSVAAALAVSVACASGGTHPPAAAPLMTAVGYTPPIVGLVGSTVPNAPAVRLVDANGQGMAGVHVIFSVTAGGGSVEGGTAKTDINGIASVAKWTLGTTAGANILTAQSGNRAVTFEATARAGAARTLVKSSTDPQSAVVNTAVAVTPSVTVEDAFGNPVAGVMVTFAVTAGGGTVTGAMQQSASTGTATLGSWTLGRIAGANAVRAFVPGLPSMNFLATGTPGPAAGLSVIPRGLVLAPHQSHLLTASKADQYGNETGTVVAATFSSANSAVATVSRSGLVTATAIGNTAITVTSGAATKVVPVYVSAGGHPTGTTRFDTPEGGRPFAVRASVKNVLLVGEQDNDLLGRYDLPGTTRVGSVAVGDDPTDIDISADGLKAYVTNQRSNTLGVIDVATNTQLSSINVGGSPFRVTRSRDGARIYVTTGEGSLVTVDAATLSARAPLALGGPLNGLAVHPSQPVIYVTSTSGMLYAVSEATGQPLASISTGGGAQEVVVSPDGTTLYIAMEYGPLQIRSTSNLELIGTIPIATGAFGAAVTPDGAQLYSTHPRVGRVLVIDLATREVLRTIDGGVPRRVTFDRTGATAFVGNEGGYVSFIK